MLVPMIPSIKPAIALPAGGTALTLALMTMARIPQVKEASAPAIPGSHQKKESRIAGTQRDTETMPRPWMQSLYAQLCCSRQILPFNLKRAVARLTANLIIVIQYLDLTVSDNEIMRIVI